MLRDFGLTEYAHVSVMLSPYNIARWFLLKCLQGTVAAKMTEDGKGEI